MTTSTGKEKDITAPDPGTKIKVHLPEKKITDRNESPEILRRLKKF